MVSAGNPDQRLNRVFISHSTHDKAIAVKLANLLGNDAWIDSWDLDAGQMLPKAVAEMTAKFIQSYGRFSASTVPITPMKRSASSRGRSLKPAVASKNR